MKVHLLGTAGYHPTAQRDTASLLLPEVGVALDAGTGFFRVRELLARDTLDIFLTHAHLDHVVGLTFLLDVLWQRPLRAVRVHGRDETLAAVREHLLAAPLFPAPLPVEWRPLPADGVELLDGGRLTWFPLEHPGGCVGFRLDWPGHALAYATDTTASETAAYREFLQRLQLLIHECNFTDDFAPWAAKTGHSHTSAVARLAADCRPEKLVLVHVNPLAADDDPVDLARARGIFPQTELGRDGDVWEF